MSPRATKRDKQNLSKADERIRILMNHAKRLMVQCDVPKRLWGFARLYETDILNRIWQARLDRTPEEVIVGFNEWCWYWNLSNENARVGRWLGVS